MKRLVTKIKSWFKDRNDRKDREFLERTRIEMEKHENNYDDSMDGLRYSLENLNVDKTKETQAEKMRELADGNRNKKPFYKDDKAKDWEQ